MRTLHLVSQRNWMAEELRAGLDPDKWEVRQHTGLSAVPPEVGFDPDHVLWAPGAYAARLMLERPDLRLAAPGPEWLPILSLARPNLTGREVYLFSARESATWGDEGFWKLAETKRDIFPSKWRTADQVHFDASSLPADSMLQYSPTRLTLSAEYRVVRNRNGYHAWSPYLDQHGVSRDDPAFMDPDARLTCLKVLGFAASVAWPAYFPFALDVGFNVETEKWIVVEANPVWSSAWYGMDLGIFAQVVAEAQGPDVPDEYLWRPDPILIQRARLLRPLPVDGTTL